MIRLCIFHLVEPMLDFVLEGDFDAVPPKFLNCPLNALISFSCWICKSFMLLSYFCFIFMLVIVLSFSCSSRVVFILCSRFFISVFCLLLRVLRVVLIFKSRLLFHSLVSWLNNFLACSCTLWASG